MEVSHEAPVELNEMGFDLKEVIFTMFCAGDGRPIEMV